MAGAENIERRAVAEIRTKGRRIEGYAAKFGSDADLGGFSERIAKGAFAAGMSADILALLDHDQSKVLGRTRSGTLRLNEDETGLAFSLDVPETQAGNDVLELAQRNDLGGMSFGFTVPDGGDKWEGRTRTLVSINLLEVSVVSAWPAYPDTEIALRSKSYPSDKDRRRRAVVVAEAML